MLYLQVFNSDKEKVLEHYILHVSKMFYGLTKLQVRQLAYKFAKIKKIPMPKSWTEKEAAGEDWLRGFHNRSEQLSLRNPKLTSLARSVGFNRPAVDNSFL